MAARFLRIFLIVLSALLPLAVQAGEGVADTEVSNALPGTPRPAVILLHGAAGTGKQLQAYIQIDKDLAPHNVVALYPSGGGRYWSLGNGIASRNDAAYLDGMIDYYVAKKIVDPNQLYIAGISNGGFMVQKMICASKYQFRGAAVVMATFANVIACETPKITPLILVNGSADKYFPEDGQSTMVQRRYKNFWSWQKTWEFWAGVNGCMADKPHHQIILPPPSGGVEIKQYTYANCRAPVVAYALQGVGHVWPGAYTSAWIERRLGPNPAGLKFNDILIETWFGR